MAEEQKNQEQPQTQTQENPYSSMSKDQLRSIYDWTWKQYQDTWTALENFNRQGKAEMIEGLLKQADAYTKKIELIRQAAPIIQAREQKTPIASN
jgi:hypothetical protein